MELLKIISDVFTSPHPGNLMRKGLLKATSRFAFGTAEAATLRRKQPMPRFDESSGSL